MAVVLDTQPPFRGDHAALALDHLGGESKVRHPVRLQIEHELEGARRKPVLIHGDIVAGEGVVGAALRLHQPVELSGWMTTGAVEHHVLEEVGEPRGPRRFVAAAGPHPVVQGDVGDVAHLPDDHAKSIGQRRGAHCFSGGYGHDVGFAPRRVCVLLWKRRCLIRGRHCASLKWHRSTRAFLPSSTAARSASSPISRRSWCARDIASPCLPVAIRGHRPSSWRYASTPYGWSASRLRPLRCTRCSWTRYSHVLISSM